MSYLSELRKFYPKSWKARIAIQRYNTHLEWEHQDPTTITIHEQTLNYGGPEEGGWHYYVGYPCLTHCIFSQEASNQRVSHLLRRVRSLGPARPRAHVDALELRHQLLQRLRPSPYPTERPYYC
jgi:hypothetical protein